MRTYEECQLRWLKENDLTIGSEVVPLFQVPSYALGWDNAWITPMNRHLNKKGTIKDFGTYGILLGGYYSFPYFCLEPVKDDCADKKIVVAHQKGNKENGFWINRSGQLCLSTPYFVGRAECPHRTDGFCNITRCVLAGEPEYYTKEVVDEYGKRAVKQVRLSLCSKTLICRADDFDDFRTTVENIKQQKENEE